MSKIEMNTVSPDKSPANPQPVEAARKERKRIPMSLPVPRLSVPDIPGYHLHWFLGSARCERALKAGYEFVDQEETELNDRSASGGEGQDMGSRVSMAAGEDLDAHTGAPSRLYLMKIPDEFWLEDQQTLETQSAKMLEALKVEGGKGGAAPADADMSHRYTPEHVQGNKNIFRPRKLRT